MAIILTIAASFSGQAYGSKGKLKNPVICHTPRMKLAFKVDNQHIAFLQHKQKDGPDRQIASSEEMDCGTRLTHKGFTKVVNYEGKKHKIHIRDVNKFSALDDYIIIRNSEGHEVTYPLNCEKY